MKEGERAEEEGERHRRRSRIGIKRKWSRKRGRR
jgi:hypothetical protein